MHTCTKEVFTYVQEKLEQSRIPFMKFCTEIKLSLNIQINTFMEEDICIRLFETYIDADVHAEPHFRIEENSEINLFLGPVQVQKMSSFLHLSNL